MEIKIYQDKYQKESILILKKSSKKIKKKKKIKKNVKKDLKKEAKRDNINTLRTNVRGTNKEYDRSKFRKRYATIFSIL